MTTLPPETNTVAVTANGELSPRERLTQSRQRISVWLDNGGDDARDNSQNDETHPMAAIFTQLLNDWWRHHPLYPSANIAAEAARRAIVPLVRRHPIAVLGVAAIAGAVLMRSRGWRWVVRPAVFAGVASQIVARVISQMPSTPAASNRPYESHATPGSSAVAPPTGRVR